MSEAARPGGEMREQFEEYARTRGGDLRDQLVEAHLGLAYQLAKRFANRGETYDDLCQVAALALINSVERFDPDRGFAFSTFATRTIIGELKRHFRDKGWAIRAPRRVQELYLELGPIIEALSHDLARPPTVTEIAQATGSSDEAVLEALEAGQSYRTSSIDAPDRRDRPIADQLGETDAGYGETEDRMVLAISLAKLSDRERIVVNLRFIEGLTQSQIATRVGVSQMQVSRLLASSLAKLRESLPSQMSP
jgi:RNA polymerase sigma-B factor